MQIFLRTCAVSAALLLASGSAHAGWYVGADGGVNFLQSEDIDGRDIDDGSIFHDQSSSKTGYALQMQGGYDFGGPKAELELGYRASGLKGLAEADSPVDGQTTSLSLMTNGIYSFMPKSKWHPFVGAGIGIARIAADWDFSDGDGFRESEWVFAYQAFTGVEYDLNQNWSAKAQYRYFATADGNFDAGGSEVEFGYQSHAIMAGVSYKFTQ